MRNLIGKRFRTKVCERASCDCPGQASAVLLQESDPQSADSVVPLQVLVLGRSASFLRQGTCQRANFTQAFWSLKRLKTGAASDHHRLLRQFRHFPSGLVCGAHHVRSSIWVGISVAGLLFPDLFDLAPEIGRRCGNFAVQIQ